MSLSGRGYDTGPSSIPPKLLPPNADRLQHLAPERDRMIHERCLVGVDMRPLPDEVSLKGLDKARSLDDLPQGESEKTCMKILASRS